MAGSHRTKLIEHIASRLGRIEGVAAVALGGSWARQEAHPDSDIDLGIYYRPDNPPSVAELRRLAEELDDRHPKDAATDLGEWGPWINGGGWLRVRGRPVDWLYRDLGKVAATIERCAAGETACHYQPGHPHGFHEHIYLGEVFHCRVLHDPEGRLQELKAAVAIYPPKLKRAIVEKYLWEAQFALHTSRKSAGRGDVFYVSGCAFRGAACLVQVLFALNERYFVNEKGSVKAAGSFELCPSSFEEVVEDVLGETGRLPPRLENSIDRLAILVDEIRALCDPVLQRGEPGGIS